MNATSSANWLSDDRDANVFESLEYLDMSQKLESYAYENSSSKDKYNREIEALILKDATQVNQQQTTRQQQQQQQQQQQAAEQQQWEQQQQQQPYFAFQSQAQLQANSGYQRLAGTSFSRVTDSQVLSSPKPQQDQFHTELKQDYEHSEYNKFVEDKCAPYNPKEKDNSHEKKRSRRNSPLWNYFDEDPQGQKICRICNKFYAAKTGNSTLRDHLISRHGIDMKNVKNTPKNQNTLSEREKNERDDALAKWIIRSEVPFQLVEDLQFKQMIYTFDSRYQFPDMDEIENLIMNHFKIKRKDLHDSIAIPGKLSLTADRWTSTFNNDTYLGLTVHYIDSNWNLQNFLLDVIPFTHTEIDIGNAIKSVLTEFQLLEKTLALTTDESVCEEGLKLELNNQAFQHYNCPAHILNLAAQQVIDDEVVKIHDLIKHLTQRCDKLRDLHLIENLTQLDAETSTYYIIKKFQKMLCSIEKLADTDQDIRRLMPDVQGRIKLNDILTLLEPLTKATELLSSSSYPTISNVRPLFLGIQRHLDYYIKKQGFSQSTLASLLLQKINQYWDIVDSSTLVAAVLDPRTKYLFSTGKESTNAIDAVKKCFTEYYTSMSQPDVSTHEYFRQLLNSNINSTGLCDELEQYLASSYNEKIAPLKWWQDNFQKFPTLGVIARDYLSIQANIASNTTTCIRNGLPLEMVRAILCSKSWLNKETKLN